MGQGTDGSAGITFVVPGQALPAGRPSTDVDGTLRAAVRVGSRRGGGQAVRVTARVNEDIVLLRLANGPTLYLHPQNARELLQAQASSLSTAIRGSPRDAPADDEVRVPARLGWDDAGQSTTGRGPSADRLGEVVLDAFEVVTDLFKGSLVDRTTRMVASTLDGQVDEGVYPLSPDKLTPLREGAGKLAAIPAPAVPGAPILVLIHGTFVDTVSTFGKLWRQHPGRVEALFRHYDDRVYALDHQTLGSSPFANALTLVRALPEGACLHLLSHSRGGIVAEILARLAGGQGLRDADLALFAAEAQAPNLTALKALAEEIRRKRIAVGRLVRVACPARGTLLASGRLDAYLSVFKWGLELAGLPILPQLGDFLAEIARRRGDPAELPGLEAMMPGRPVAEWLNAPAEPVSGDLRVVAGDMAGDEVLSWLITLISDGYYWTDNDLVVQTRSMYGGTPREAGAATFLLDRGGSVSHFNYFSNESTADAISRALTQEQPAGFRLIGPLSWAGEEAGGLRAARPLSVQPASERPAVFLLPGILGSHLRVDGRRIWLSLRLFNSLERLAWDPQTVPRVRPDGPVGMSYEDLIDHLADTHEVIPFSFDWRRPIEDEAERLADAVELALSARQHTGQPVRLLGHSMGGIVARTMALQRPGTWKRMMSRPGARLLMLGTPNGGSFAPMQVLSGDDTFGNLLSVFGSLFDGLKARQLMAGMPGLLQLQAGIQDGDHRLHQQDGWRSLESADLEFVQRRIDRHAWWHSDRLQTDSLRWGIPPQTVLDQAAALRERLDRQAEQWRQADTANIVLVVGSAPLTPADVKATRNGVVYLDVRDAGDGRVTHASAVLPGVRTWQVDAGHGDLAAFREAFDGYVELLTHGETHLLPALPAGVRSRGVVEQLPPPDLVPGRPARALRSNTPPSVLQDVLAAAEAPSSEPGPGAGRLRVVLVNGNLKFVGPPLMLGHYQSAQLTGGTESVIDALLDGALSEALQAGLYPSAVGSSQVFMNTRQNAEDPFVLPRPEAAIVVGLGEEGSLRMSELTDTVRRGVLAYAQRVSEQDGGGATTFELAATLMGTGVSSMSAGMAAQAIVGGVREANQRLAQVDWPQVCRLELVELHLDRATEALQALSELSDVQARGLVLDPHVKPGRGGLSRPADIGYRGADYDFFSIRRNGKGRYATVEFALDTRRARDEVRGSVAQSRLIEALLKVGVRAKNQDPSIGRTLFKLLVPLEIEPFLSGSASLLLRLDNNTAAYPWELLSPGHDDLDRRDDRRPWAVRCRLLRKLRTPDFRARPQDAGREAGALIIGAPLCPEDRYPELPGAIAEARAVRRALRDAAVLGAEARVVLEGDALDVVNAVMDGRYRILHIAGHGDIHEGVGGVVLSDGASLGPAELEAKRMVPELAFINCCHLGRMQSDPGQRVNPLGENIPRFAANVAEQLIRIGVRCVVAAGWAVDDEPAALFARRFYEELLRGRPFVEAVAKAREAAWEKYPGSNTWAAYQCYGDPWWTLQGSAGQAPVAAPSPSVPSSEALQLRLHALATQHRYEGRSSEETGLQVRQLDALYRGTWGTEGPVACAFGEVYGEIGDFSRAIACYERAVHAEDGRATLRAVEQMANLRARHAEGLPNRTGKRKELNEAIKLLERILTIAPTSERESLLGSAYKRLSTAEAAGSSRGETAMRKALEHYRNAERLARMANSPDLHYPAMNRMALALVLAEGDGPPEGFGDADFGAVRKSLQQKNAEDPDFWSVAGLTELRVYMALAEKRLAPALGGILADLRDLRARVSSAQMWKSVLDQARFVLASYPGGQTPDAERERQAAATLLSELDGYAGSGQETGAGTIGLRRS